MKKYLRVYKKLVELGVSIESQYRKDTALGFIAQGIQFATALLFIEAVYSQINLIPGWTKEELFVLTLLVDLQNKVFVFLFQGNFNYMEQLIHSGKFDFLLTKPISPLFYATNRVIRIRAATLIFLSLTTIMLIAYHFSLQFTFSGIFRAAYMGFWGVVMMYAISLLVNCLLFRNSQIGNVNNILGELRYQGRYPFNIFPHIPYIVFTTILPVTFFGYFATAALFGKLDVLTYLFVPLLSSFVCFCSILLWRKQVKHYSSASS